MSEMYSHVKIWMIDGSTIKERAIADLPTLAPFNDAWSFCNLEGKWFNFNWRQIVRVEITQEELTP